MLLEECLQFFFLYTASVSLHRCRHVTVCVHTSPLMVLAAVFVFVVSATLSISRLLSVSLIGARVRCRSCGLPLSLSLELCDCKRPWDLQQCFPLMCDRGHQPAPSTSDLDETEKGVRMKPESSADFYQASNHSVGH